MRIRKETIRKATTRNRECINCGCIIKKGEKYGNRLFSYDGKMITFNYCLSDTCYPSGFKTCANIVLANRFNVC